MRVIIIANGDLDNPGYYKELFNDQDFIICVNGGSRHALAIGLLPQLLIGDLDSLEPSVRKKMLAAQPRLIEYPPEKDHSDLELALRHAVAMEPTEIVIVGALGGERFDHAFINVLLLLIPLEANIPAAIIDQSQEIRLFDQTLAVEGQPGDQLSLFALKGEARGLVTKGLQYPLNDELLNFASSRGLSNLLTGNEAFVSLKEGLVLAILKRE